MTLRFRIQGIIVEQSPSYCDGPEKRKLGILALAWVFPFSTSPLPWSLANGTVPHLRKVYLLNNPSGNVLADVAGDVPWSSVLLGRPSHTSLRPPYSLSTILVFSEEKRQVQSMVEEEGKIEEALPSATGSRSVFHEAQSSSGLMTTAASPELEGLERRDQQQAEEHQGRDQWEWAGQEG